MFVIGHYFASSGLIGSFFFATVSIFLFFLTPFLMLIAAFKHLSWYIPCLTFLGSICCFLMSRLLPYLDKTDLPDKEEKKKEDEEKGCDGNDSDQRPMLRSDACEISSYGEVNEFTIIAR